MFISHVVWMTWVCVVVSLGSLRCFWVEGSANVALSVPSGVPRLAVGRNLAPLCTSWEEVCRNDAGTSALSCV